MHRCTGFRIRIDSPHIRPRKFAGLLRFRRHAYCIPKASHSGGGRPTDVHQVIGWANREFQREVRKNDSSINLGKACLLLALEEQAALQAKLLEYQQQEGNIRAAGNVGRTPASASTWSLERLDAIAAEARSAFLQLLEEDGAASELSPGEGPASHHKAPALNTEQHEGAATQTSPGERVPIVQGGSTRLVPSQDSLWHDESRAANQTPSPEVSAQADTFQERPSGVAPSLNSLQLGDSPATSENPTVEPAQCRQSPQGDPATPHPSQLPSTASASPDAVHAAAEPSQGAAMSASCASTDDASPSMTAVLIIADDGTAHMQTTADSAQCSTATPPVACNAPTESAQCGSTGGAQPRAHSPGGTAQHAQHDGTALDQSHPPSISANGRTGSNDACSTSQMTDADVLHRVQEDHGHLSAGHGSRAPALDPGPDASSSQLAGAGSAGPSTPLRPSMLPPSTTAAAGALRGGDMRAAGTEALSMESLGDTVATGTAPCSPDAPEGAGTEPPPAGGDAAAWQLALRHPLKLLEAVNSVLFERHGYHSTRQLGNPWDADFSSVLEAGSGCPPALCILYMEICQRLGFPLEASVLEGGRYVVLWPRQPPLMVGGSRLVIDAYSGGGMLSMEEVCAMFDIPGPELVPSPRCELLAALLAVVRDTHWAAAAGCSPVPALMVPLSLETALSRRVQPGLGGFSMERAVAAAKKRLQVLPDSREAQLDYALLLYFAGQRDDAWQELGIYVEAADGSGEEAARARLLLEKLRLMLEPISLH